MACLVDSFPSSRLKIETSLSLRKLEKNITVFISRWTIDRQFFFKIQFEIVLSRWININIYYYEMERFFRV
jgi:hypothetical protein